MGKMKIKDTFILKQVMDEYIIVPFGGDTVDFNSMITLNETGAFIWNCMTALVTLEDVAEKICSEYNIDMEQALNDVNEFAAKLAKEDVLENV